MCPDLLSQKYLLATLNTPPPIWATMRLKYQYQCGGFLNGSAHLNIFIAISIQHRFYSIQRLPFNWKSPKGYFIAVLLQMVVSLYPMCYLGTFSSLAVGAFIFATLALKELKSKLKSIKKRAKSKQNQFELWTQFVKFYQLHTDLKQLSKLKYESCFRNQMDSGH